jgi:hypothetical protein
MFPLVSRVKFFRKAEGRRQKAEVIGCKLILLFLLLLPNSTAYAHKVQTTTDVGATLHLEPNDNPRAGEATKTWFALTRRGGKVIPLTECNCQLAVYAEPSLQPVAAEKYKGIPGSEITFPRPGAYLLQLSGKPKKAGSFQPFELKFSVTVATGSVKTEPAAENNARVQNLSTEVNPSQSQGTPIWAIASLTLAVLGVSFAVWRRKRD